MSNNNKIQLEELQLQAARERLQNLQNVQREIDSAISAAAHPSGGNKPKVSRKRVIPTTVLSPATETAEQVVTNTRRGKRIKTTFTTRLAGMALGLLATGRKIFGVPVQLLMLALPLLTKLPFVGKRIYKVQQRVQRFMLKATLVTFLVIVRKILVICLALFGLYMIFRVIGYKPENFFIGLWGASYGISFVNLVQRLFNWILNWFDNKIPTPTNAASTGRWWWGHRNATWTDSAMNPNSVTAKMFKTAHEHAESARININNYLNPVTGATPASRPHSFWSWDNKYLVYAVTGLISIAVIWGSLYYMETSINQIFNNLFGPQSGGPTNPPSEAAGPEDDSNPEAQSRFSSLRNSIYHAAGYINPMNIGRKVVEIIRGPSPSDFSVAMEHFKDAQTHPDRITQGGAYKYQDYYPYHWYNPLDSWTDFLRKSYVGESVEEKRVRLLAITAWDEIFEQRFEAKYHTKWSELGVQDKMVHMATLQNARLSEGADAPTELKPFRWSDVPNIPTINVINASPPVEPPITLHDNRTAGPSGYQWVSPKLDKLTELPSTPTQKPHNLPTDTTWHDMKSGTLQLDPNIPGSKSGEYIENLIKAGKETADKGKSVAFNPKVDVPEFAKGQINTNIYPYRGASQVSWLEREVNVNIRAAVAQGPLSPPPTIPLPPVPETPILSPLLKDIKELTNIPPHFTGEVVDRVTGESNRKMDELLDALQVTANEVLELNKTTVLSPIAEVAEVDEEATPRPPDAILESGFYGLILTISKATKSLLERLSLSVSVLMANYIRPIIIFARIIKLQQLWIFGHNEILPTRLQTEIKIGILQRLLDYIKDKIGTLLAKIGRVLLRTGLFMAPGAVTKLRTEDLYNPSERTDDPGSLESEYKICCRMVDKLDIFAGAVSTTAASLDSLLTEFSLANSEDERLRIYIQILACLGHWEELVQELNFMVEFDHTILLFLAQSKVRRPE